MSLGACVQFEALINIFGLFANNSIRVRGKKILLMVSNFDVNMLLDRDVIFVLYKRLTPTVINIRLL